MVTKQCNNCGKLVNYATPADLKRKSSSDMCRSCWLKHVPTGEGSSRWSGGVVIHGRGYRLIYKPEHPFAKGNGYVFEHRLVMEKHIGRYLAPNEIIHHLNSIKDDNRIENLIITNNVEHSHKYDAKRPSKSCSILDCTKKHLGRGFCKSHYWTEYLQEARKHNGWNDKHASRARERRKIKKD